MDNFTENKWYESYCHDSQFVNVCVLHGTVSAAQAIECVISPMHVHYVCPAATRDQSGIYVAAYSCLF